MAAALDWSTLTFRDAEMFTDLPQGERRAADLVAQVSALGGLQRLILLHVEVQRQRQARFPLRMWQYYAALRLREDLPVLPIALLLYPAEQGLSLATYEEEVLGQTYLTFRYLQISAPLLPAEEYVGAATPLGASLHVLNDLGGQHVGRRQGSAGCDPRGFVQLRCLCGGVPGAMLS